EHGLTTGGAQGSVNARQHAPQSRCSVRREQAETFRLAARTELRKRRRERLAPQHRALSLVELPEARVEPGDQWIRLQQPVAEAVNRRDPRSVQLTCEIGAPELDEPRADARAELARGPLRVRDHEDRG